MKAIAIAFAVSLLFAINLSAQQIQSYDAFIQTKSSGIVKGILYHVTDAGLILQQPDSVVAIDAADIKMIKIYASTTPYKYKKIFTYDPWSDDNYETKPNQIVRTRKWNEKDPTFQEEVTGHIATAAINVTANLIALPFSAIRGNIFKAKINHKTDRFKKIKNELYYYSIDYQVHDSGAELKKANLLVNKGN